MEGSNASVERSSSGGRAVEDQRQGSSVELSSSNSDGDRVSSKDAQLESTKAEMGEVRKENERLRMHLDKMIKDYQALEKQFKQAARHVHDHKIITSTTNPQATTDSTTSESHRELEEENELVSLSLGRTSSIDLKRSKVTQENERESLGLGLGDYKLLEGSTSDAPPADQVSPLPGLENISSSVEETAKEESAARGSSWPHQKDLKRRDDDNGGPSHPSSGKRARVCLRIRCETPTVGI